MYGFSMIDVVGLCVFSLFVDSLIFVYIKASPLPPAFDSCRLPGCWLAGLLIDDTLLACRLCCCCLVVVLLHSSIAMCVDSQGF